MIAYKVDYFTVQQNHEKALLPPLIGMKGLNLSSFKALKSGVAECFVWSVVGGWIGCDG